MNKAETTNNELQCCIDYCKTSFNVAGREVVNNYKCNQPPFTAAELWQIAKSRKVFTAPSIKP